MSKYRNPMVLYPHPRTYIYKQIRGTISFFPHPGPRANNISISVSINVNVNSQRPTSIRRLQVVLFFYLVLTLYSLLLYFLGQTPDLTLSSLIPTLYSLPPSSEPLSALHHKRIKVTKRKCKYKYIIEN